MYLMQTPEGVTLHHQLLGIRSSAHIELDLSEALHLRLAAVCASAGCASDEATDEVEAVIESLGLQHEFAQADDMVAVLAARCRVCGCSDYDACLDPGGEPCHWTEPDLRSAYASLAIQPRTVLDQAEEWHHRMDGMARVLGGAS